MEKKRVLIIAQEIKPYAILSSIAEIARKLPQHLQEQGMELRLLMPRFGTINERRHRLHEVVRLSGINIVIGEEDFPLIIKVASLPGTKLQVYFLDNEDLFKRKFIFNDDKEKFYEDNADRMVFFCKGAIETVKKFGWPPDVVHCHGWMTSLIPMYLKTAYKKDPIFANSKVIYSMYENSFKESLTKSFIDKAAIKDNTEEKDFELFKKGDENALNIGAAHYSDALIEGDENLDKDLKAFVKKAKNKQVLDYKEYETGELLPAYHDFYTMLINE